MKKMFFVALMAIAAFASCGGNKNAEQAEAPAEEVVAPGYEFTRVNCVVKLNNAADRAKLIELGKQLVAASQSDEGMIKYDMMESLSSETTFLVFETWKNEEVLAKHMATPHFTTLIPQIQEIATLEIGTINKPLEGTPAPEKYAFTRVNCGVALGNASNAAKLEELGKQLVAASQNDEGEQDYDMLRSLTNPTQYLVYETWKNEDVLAKHMATPHFTTLIPQIQEIATLTIETFDVVE